MATLLYYWSNQVQQHEILKFVAASESSIKKIKSKLNEEIKQYFFKSLWFLVARAV